MKLVTRTHMKGCSESLKEEKKTMAFRNNDCTIIQYLSHTMLRAVVKQNNKY